MQKLLLLSSIVSLVFFGYSDRAEKKDLPSNDSIHYAFINIDSIKNSIAKTGFNSSSLNVFSVYLLNASYVTQTEEQFLAGLKKTSEREYLLALIHKRQSKFNEIYNLLKNSLSLKPQFYAFYDELVNSAIIINKLDDLKYNTPKIPGKYFYYVNSLLNAASGKFETAEEEIKSGIDIYPEEFELLFQHAVIFRHLGDYEKALSSINKSLVYAKNENSINSALVLKGSLYYLSDNLVESKKIFSRIIKNSEKMIDKTSLAKALINLGIIVDEDGNIEKAREYFNKALEIAEAINNIEIKALAYSELGVSFSFTNELIDAKTVYLKSIDLYQSINNKVRLSFLYSNLGRVFQSYYNFPEAFESFKKGLDFAGENKRAKIQNLIGLADISMNLSNYAKALEYYNEASKLASEIKAISLQTEINNGLGSLNYNLNLNSKAINYFSKVEKQYVETEDYYGLADVYDKMGLVYFKSDSLELAEKYFREAIKNAGYIKNNFAVMNSRLNLANLYLQKNPDTAEKILNEIILPEEDIYADLISQKYLLDGKIKSIQKEYNLALKYFQIANEIARTNDLIETQIENYYEIAKVYEKLNILSEAEKNYNKAIEMIESSSNPLFGNNESQIGYLSEKIQIYYSLAELYIKSGKYDSAMECIENARARNTTQHLRNLALQSIIKDKGKLNRLIELDWSIKSGMHFQKEDLLRKEFEDIKFEILREYPKSAKYFNQNNNASLKKFQTALKENEFVLSLYLSDSALITFVLGKNSVNHYQVNISREKIKNLMGKITPYLKENSILQNGLVNQDLFSFNAQHSYKFFNLILKNALEEIPKNSKLVFSVPPELASVPFEFLITKFHKEESPFDYKNVDFLIFDYNISYVSSINNYFVLLKNNTDNSDEALLMGDPVIENTTLFAERRGLLNKGIGEDRNINLLPLKYSREEILQIDNSVGKSNVLLSFDATESNFKKFSPLSSIIHLSTHSFLNGNQPVIFFSNLNDRDNDGFLELGEIMKLELSCDLIVLSSCNSGKGLVDKAEGVLGMTKAFLESGSRSVVVSLWDVNDKYTSILMSFFYKNLGEGLDKSAALRKAKIEAIKSYSPNPYFWAAFTLNGNTDDIEISRSKPIKIYIFGVFLFLAFLFTIYSLRKMFVLRKFFAWKD